VIESFMSKIKFKERFASDPRRIFNVYITFSLSVHLILEMFYLKSGSSVMIMINTLSVIIYNACSTTLKSL